MTLTRAERETTLRWDQAGDIATVYTHDKGLISMLERRGFQADQEYRHGAAVVAKQFAIPKDLLSVRVKPLRSERQRQASIALGKRHADARKANKPVGDSALAGVSPYPNPSEGSSP